jgi:hypothetical protein
VYKTAWARLANGVQLRLPHPHAQADLHEVLTRVAQLPATTETDVAMTLNRALECANQLELLFDCRLATTEKPWFLHPVQIPHGPSKEHWSPADLPPVWDPLANPFVMQPFAAGQGTVRASTDGSTEVGNNRNSISGFAMVFHPKTPGIMPLVVIGSADTHQNNYMAECLPVLGILSLVPPNLDLIIDVDCQPVISTTNCAPISDRKRLKKAARSAANLIQAMCRQRPEAVCKLPPRTPIKRRGTCSRPPQWRPRLG